MLPAQFDRSEVKTPRGGEAPTAFQEDNGAFPSLRAEAARQVPDNQERFGRDGEKGSAHGQR
jgi:hypothetical protein